MTEVSASDQIVDHIDRAITAHCPAAVAVIWEIGSRDGLDGLALSRAHPNARVICFEPNPDTFQQVARNAARAENVAIDAYPYALCDEDGPVTFFKIDPVATRTTWSDGNPGASSLYVASGEYPKEDYVQVPVTVKGRRAKTVIEQGVPVPDLVWMDVQGAELSVLQGFGDRLWDVSAIYVELSLRPIYTGQALAADVVRFLSSSGFRWHSVTRTGEWQFDALFVRGGRYDVRLIARDRALNFSLKSRLQFGIRQHVPTPRRLAKSVRVRAMRVAFRLLLEMASRELRARLRLVRVAYEQSLPVDPLEGSALPPITVLIPCVAKDAAVVQLAVESAAIGVRNPIERVVLMAPAEDHVALSALGVGAELLADEEQDLPRSLRAIEELVPSERRGWVKQQVLKLGFAARAAANGVLILDADTILIQPRAWLAGDRQLLPVVHEYYEPYLRHAARCLGPNVKDEGLSWVAHHQLMQPRVVRDMLSAILQRDMPGEGRPEPTDLDIDRALEAWVRSADFNESSALSEYHCYGAFLRQHEPDNAVLARWSNVAAARSTVPLDRGGLVKLFPAALSVSCHAYLK